MTSTGLNVPMQTVGYAQTINAGKNINDVDTLIRAGLEADEDTEAQKQINAANARADNAERYAGTMAEQARKEAYYSAKKEIREETENRNRRIKALTAAERDATKLYNMLMNPNKKKHIPTALQPLVKQMFEDISFVRFHSKIEALQERLERARKEIVRLEAYQPTESIRLKIESWKRTEEEILQKLEGAYLYYIKKTAYKGCLILLYKLIINDVVCPREKI